MIAKLTALVLPAVLLFMGPASAQSSYPNRPITWIVPFPAGNTTDNAARIVAKALSERLGQQVVVDNRPGAGGIIGVTAVAQSQPDGYTMLYGSSGPIATFVSLYKKLVYDPQKSFVAVNGVGASPLILVANPNKPYKTIGEFVDYLKKNPGQVNFGSPGTGTGSHLAGELFQTATGTKMTHVPYKESGSLYGDLLSGRIDAIFDFVSVMRQNIDSGAVRLLGVSDNVRLKTYPNTPTFKEAGVDAEIITWSSILLPAGTSSDIVQKISAATQEALKAPEVLKFQQDNDQASLGELGPDKLKTFIADEITKYRVLVDKAGLKLD